MIITFSLTQLSLHMALILALNYSLHATPPRRWVNFHFRLSSAVWRWLFKNIDYHAFHQIFYCFLQGLAITFVADEEEAKVLNGVQERFDVDITELPDEIDLSTYIEGR